MYIKPIFVSVKIHCAKAQKTFNPGLSLNWKPIC